MSLELRSYITANNSQYMRTLQATQSETQVFAGRIGAAFKVHTSGVLSLARGIGAVGAVAAAGVGAVVGLARAIDLIATREIRLASALAEEASRRREIARLVDSLRPGRDGQEAERVQIQNRFNDALEQTKAKLRELELSMAPGASFLESVKNMLLYGYGDGGKADMDIFSARIAAAEAYRKALRELPELERQALAAAERRRESAIGELQAKAMIDALRLEGDLRESAVLQEGLVTAERRKQIELLTTDAALREKLLHAEIRRHQAAMRAIEEEDRRRREQAAEEARRKADEEAREKRRIEDVRARAALDERSLDAEAARLAGDEKRARLIELEVEHKRRLHEIERNEDLDAETRKRLIEKETANYALRVRAAEDESLRGGGRGDVRTFAVGQYGSAELIARALGAGESANARRERNEKRQADLLQECRDILARWMAAGNGQLLSGATRALGVN